MDGGVKAAVVVKMAKEYVHQCMSVLLPQSLWKKEYMEIYTELNKFAQENSISLFVYQLEAPKDILLDRIEKRPQAVLATTPVPQERIEKNLKTWEDNRYTLGKIFDTSKYSPEEIVQLILKDLTSSK